MTLAVVVLAAGAGKRMRSELPKVLHPLAGRPLIEHVLDLAESLQPDVVQVVVGEQAERVKARLAKHQNISWVLQQPRLGTGHAVAQALPHVAPESTVLVLLGDMPLVRSETLAECVRHGHHGLGIVTAEVEAPHGFGRILRADGRVVGIVEERDATAAQREIKEVNTGILAAPAKRLADLLHSVDADNEQGEYYLTDVVALAAACGMAVTPVPAATSLEALGVNDRAQLARLERRYQRRQAETLMAAGVTLMDPRRFDVRGVVTAGEDCVIDVGVVLEGEVRLGTGVRIGANCVIRDSHLEDGVEVLPMSCIDGAVVAAGCRIGPFARLRPGTELGRDVHIGNFVETKKARLGEGVKANHLAYLGDASVGDASNIGAGAITCNYDGVNKHQTTIGKGVFVGTNATLVAPVTIEDDAYIGGGSTVTAKVGRNELAVGRGRQRNIQGWIPPAKRRSERQG